MAGRTFLRGPTRDDSPRFYHKPGPDRRFSLVAVVIAALNLGLDSEFIEQAACQ